MATGGALAAMSSGRPSHCSTLNTVKRLRNGMARGASPLVVGPLALVVGDEAVGIDDGRPALALAHVAAETHVG